MWPVSAVIETDVLIANEAEESLPQDTCHD